MKKIKTQFPLMVISAPSGTGKTTVVKKLLKINKALKRVITHTTREKRTGEKNKRDYYFVSKKKFLSEKKAGHFVEWAKVYQNHYGTSKKEIERIKKLGKVPVLVIEEQGARQVKKIFEDVLFVCLLPPSLKELKKRMMGRNTENAASLKLRFQSAQKEIKAMKWYDHFVVNKKLTTTVKQLNRLIQKNFS